MDPAIDRESRRPWAIAFAVSVAIHVCALGLGVVGWLAPGREGSSEPEGRPVNLGIIRALPETPVEPPPAASVPEPEQLSPPDEAAIAKPIPTPVPSPAPAESEPVITHQVPEPSPTEVSLAPREPETPGPIANAVPAATSPPPSDPAPGVLESVANASASSPGNSSMSWGDVPLQALYAPRPIYPETARRRGLTGEVTIRFQVSERGTVSDVKVVRSSGHPTLDQSAATAVRTYRFVPVQINGVAISTNAQITFPFVLD